MALIQIMVLSTKHVSRSAKDWLMDRDAFDPTGYPLAMEGAYGWLLCVPKESQDLDGVDWPPDLVRVLAYAMGHGVPYVKLDAGAKPISDLPTLDGH